MDLSQPLDFELELESRLEKAIKYPIDVKGVETKRIKEALKNNPDKFPAGYIIELNKREWVSLKSKFSTSIKGGKVKLPSAFPEKGLYILATILKSPQAVQATLAIIETFAKIRQLSRSIQDLNIIKEPTTNCLAASGLFFSLFVIKEQTKTEYPVNHV